MTDHPFIPGTRVAVQAHDDWRIPVSFKSGVVAKVLKSGRFTLEGSPQQWRAYPPSSNGWWHAISTGSSNGSLRIWDHTTEADILNKNAIARRCRRYETARSIIDRQSFSELVTDDVVEKMEAIVAAIKPQKKEAA